MVSERVQRRIDKLLDQAEEAADEFDWARVRDASLSVIAADPENGDAKTFLAMAEPHIGSLPSGHMPQGGEGATAPSPQPSRSLGRV